MRRSEPERVDAPVEATRAAGAANAGTNAGTRRRPTLAVWKFASCDGCQLTLLDCEDELLALAEAIDIAHFPEATSASVAGPYDLSLVEGSITTAHDAERIREVRRQSRTLVTIGACATAGGVQALRNFADVDEYVAIVYARPDYIETLATSTPVSAHVKVDFELRGCPIDKRQLLETISAFIAGRRPQTPAHSVCVECKARGTPCVMVARGTPCLGPVTQAGCGAICPAYDRGCYGCFGPMEAPNVASLGERWLALGASRRTVRLAYHSFNAGSAAFREAGERYRTGADGDGGRHASEGGGARGSAGGGRDDADADGAPGGRSAP